MDLRPSLVRPLSLEERAILDRLLTFDFPGRDDLRSQIKNAQVSDLDENGSLRIFTTDTRRAQVLSRIPTEGSCQDVDGITVHLLLHVVDGVVNELEIFK
jgi:hypothetical protein